MTTRIGVSMNYRRTESGRERAYLDSPYFDFLVKLKVQPVPIVPVDSIEILREFLQTLDGILFSGGLDLDPKRWQEPLHEKTILVHPRREQFDFVLYEQAAEMRLPIMGIGLRLQMINVYHGGCLHQHLEENPGKIDHGQELNNSRHNLNLNKNSKLYEWLQKDRITVPSGHHQGIAKLGKGLLAGATSDDGVIEAIERPGYSFLIAVQWHPEREPQAEINQAIIERFLEAANKYAQR